MTLGVRALRPSDRLRLATVGLRTRRLRAALSALGIAIGVAAIVAVLGLSAPPRQGCWRRSTGWGPTCSRSATARASRAAPPSCPSGRRA